MSEERELGALRTSAPCSPKELQGEPISPPNSLASAWATEPTELDTSPSQRVMTSEDLLPIILLDLKRLSQQESDGSKGWKHNLAPLLRVNHTHFHATANLLWNTMDNLTHVFQLLRWFKPAYKGIGTDPYAGSENWERFSFYADRIQHFHLTSATDIQASTSGFMELYTLPERPDPFFRALSSVTLDPEAIPGIPFLFLLTSPSLRVLRIETTIFNPELRRPVKTPAESFISALPRLAFSAPRLHTFKYTGPTNEELFMRLSKFRALESICIESNTGVCLADLWRLRSLTMLRNIKFAIPFVYGRFPDRRIVTNNLKFTKEAPGLDSVHIIAKQHSHCLIARVLPPGRIRNLHLEFVDMSAVMPLHLCLALYIEASPEMETLNVEFKGNNQEDSDDPNYDWPSSGQASELLLFAIRRRSECLRVLDVLKFPLALAASTYHILQEAIMHYKSLTSLRFTLKLGDSSPQVPPTPSSQPFPGLAFLATMCTYCQSLEAVDLHFDATLIMNEDLSLKNSKDTASPTPPPGVYYKLRYLNVNTGNTLAESSKLEIPLSRKMVIAKFLDHLFPTLSYVRGSVESLWEEIDILIKSYQELRQDILGEVEALLESPRSA